MLLAAALGESGGGALPDEEIVAPPLAWSEAMSALHESMWRRERSREIADETLSRLLSLKVGSRSPQGARQLAWRLANDLGWAKTYDAEYVALAAALRCDLATLDLGLRAGAERLGVKVRALA